MNGGAFALSLFGMIFFGLAKLAHLPDHDIVVFLAGATLMTLAHGLAGTIGHD